LSSESTTGTLQFDTVVPAASAGTPFPANTVVCGNCQQHLTHQYYDVNGMSVCDSCRNGFVEQLTSPSGLAVMLRAAMFGLGAAIAGAVLYYAVVAITNFEIGLVAIAIGYMVGYAIRHAARGRGGRRLQVLAVVLTYWAVGLAYTPLAIKAAYDGATTESVSRSAANDKPVTTDESDGASVAVVAAYVMGLSFVLPVMFVLGSLPSGAISALIIGLGMRQAWQMTGVAKFEVSGPFTIASPAASSLG
jgi:hypothetical protein